MRLIQGLSLKIILILSYIISAHSCETNEFLKVFDDTKITQAINQTNECGDWCLSTYEAINTSNISIRQQLVIPILQVLNYFMVRNETFFISYQALKNDKELPFELKKLYNESSLSQQKIFKSINSILLSSSQKTYNCVQFMALISELNPDPASITQLFEKIFHSRFQYLYNRYENLEQTRGSNIRLFSTRELKSPNLSSINRLVIFLIP